MISKTALQITLVFIFNFCWIEPAVSQKDSLRLYREIKRLAFKHKLTRLAYEAVFRDPEPLEYPKDPAGTEEKNVNPFLKVNDKYVSRIEVTVLDPFGYSLTDTTGKVKGIKAMGNNLHLTTREFIVLNRLLFKPGDKVDPLRFSESERLLREAIFINDARISVSSVSADSVMVHVLVIDKWPLSVAGEVTDLNANAQFRNNNLFGSGQQFEQYAKIFRDRTYILKAYYHVSNFGKTYISSRVGYQYTQNETSTYLTVDKPFYSFLAKWAGGVYVYHSWRKYNYYDTLSALTKSIPLNNMGYDLWLGHAFKLGTKKNLLNQSTNLIGGARYFDNVFLNRPPFHIDTVRSFKRYQAALLSAGVAVQQYYKDKFIYRFGANEDVPEGILLQVTGGMLWKEYHEERYYSGFEVARAKHFGIGYFSATFRYGIYYNKGLPNDITTGYSLHYFSELLRKRRWFFRQFFNYEFLHGENKMDDQAITLRAEDLYGFRNGDLSGNTKMVLNSETVAYMPYNLVGFKFAPVLMVGLGMIGSKEAPIKKGRVYQAYSLGMMFRNENLLVSTFQISLGFYPYLPGVDHPVFLYNPVTSFTLRVRGFSVGRPDFVGY